MITARHSGKIGDVIYSIPALKRLGVNVLYMPEVTGECTNLFSQCKSLIESVDVEPRQYPDNWPYTKQAPGIFIDYDMDLARLQPLKGKTHIVKRYLDAFGCRLDNWKEPWIKVASRLWIDEEFVAISFTGNHLINKQTGDVSQVDWTAVVNRIPEKVLFFGTPEEHLSFCKRFTYVDYIPTMDIWQLAHCLSYAKAVYCNQSAVMATAQGLGKTLYGQFKPKKTNCRLYRDNEYELI